MTDYREIAREVVKASYKKALELLTEQIKANPDVYRRGPQEFLKPRITAKETLPVRKQLRTMDAEAFAEAIDQMVEATSLQEAAQVLNRGRQ